MFLSHDEDNELDDEELYYDDDVESDLDVYTNQFPPRMQPLSRQSSIGSSNGLRTFSRKRSNSLSAIPPPPPPPPFMMDSPRRQPPGNYFYPPPLPPPSHQRLNPRFVGPSNGGNPLPSRRTIHSVPTSPQLSMTSDSSSEDYAPPPRRASINVAAAVGHSINHHNGRVGRSMSFSNGFPSHAAINMAPPPPPPPPPPPSAQMPPIVLHPPPMPHPMMDGASRPNSMYSLPSGAIGGNFFDQMMSSNQRKQQATTAPVTPIDNPSSANASAAGDIPVNSQSSQQSQPLFPSVIAAAAANMQQQQQHKQQQQPLNMQMPPPPPTQQIHPWGNGFPTSPGEPNMFNQQGMMPPPHPPSQMMLPPMFNNPMMGQNQMMNQNSMWNFMPEMMFGQGGNGDFPLPFMYSSDPNLIAQAMSSGGPNFGGPGGMDGSNNMHSPHMNMNGNPSDGPSGSNAGPSNGVGNSGTNSSGPPPSHEEEIMRRSAGSGGNEPPNSHDMMMMPGLSHQPPPNSAPMLRRGLSMLGGLFGGGGNSGGSHREDFHGGPSGGPPHPMFGSFSAPIQAQSKKEAKLQRQYEELGTFYCWRRMEGPDQHFESFSIDNQKLIKKKLSKAQPQTQIMLKREKKLPGEIMVDLQQNRGCYLVKMGGDPVVVMLEIEQKSYGGNNYIFGGGNGSDGQQQHQQGPPHQW
jgi:hypothetical protein